MNTRQLGSFHLTMLLGLIFGTACLGGENVPISPGTYKDALRKAAEAGKPVMFKFYHRDQTDWKRLEADLAQMPETVKKFVVYVVDAEQNQALVQQYNVHEYPALVFVKPDGTEITRQHGLHTRVEYQQQFLEKVLVDAGPIAKAQKARHAPSDSTVKGAAERQAFETAASNDLKMALNKFNLGRKTEALKAFKQIIAKYPGTQAAEQAQEKLDELDPAEKSREK